MTGYPGQLLLFPMPCMSCENDFTEMLISEWVQMTLEMCPACALRNIHALDEMRDRLAAEGELERAAARKREKQAIAQEKRAAGRTQRSIRAAFRKKGLRAVS